MTSEQSRHLLQSQSHGVYFDPSLPRDDARIGAFSPYVRLIGVRVRGIFRIDGQIDSHLIVAVVAVAAEGMNEAERIEERGDRRHGTVDLIDLGVPAGGEEKVLTGIAAPSGPRAAAMIVIVVVVVVVEEEGVRLGMIQVDVGTSSAGRQTDDGGRRVGVGVGVGVVLLGPFVVIWMPASMMMTPMLLLHRLDDVDEGRAVDGAPFLGAVPLSLPLSLASALAVTLVIVLALEGGGRAGGMLAAAAVASPLEGQREGQ
mmetsp:Transcript_40912/g.123343  ORF Transcript_40912/g.123343 Transcript_40912/m.123343 type:complete len:258 (-) Transcript_40912:907-1680(-)